MYIHGKTIETPGFNDNAHLHICSICLRHDVSSLTEIQYLQIEPSEREQIPMKVWCLKCFICSDSSDEQSTLDGLKKVITYSFISFLSLLVEWIPAIRNHLQFMVIHELWNSIIFLNFKTSLVIAPFPTPERQYDILRMKIDIWLTP